MIVEITGLPGNGKTLYAIKYVKDWAEREGRPVFYSGIPELTLPWTEIEPEKWFECPKGAIVIIDECQRVFRPRSMGKEVPEAVAKLETHRHQGIDIVLITQHPLLTDTAVRRLVGLHFHLVRKWGTQNATIHEWPSVRETCDKPAGRKDSIKHHWAFDKSIYNLYKSAELHTHKRRIPMHVVLFCVLPFLLAGLVWYYMHWHKSKLSPDAVVPGQQAKTSADAAKPSDQKRMGYQNAKDDAKQYVFENTARVEGMQHTAPKYDEVTKPTTAPVPAACVQMGDTCRCYSQQATRLQVEKSVCLLIVHNGYFVDFDINGRKAMQDTKTGGDAGKPSNNSITPVVTPAQRVLSVDEGQSVPQHRKKTDSVVS